jgi:hypothetical protein
MFNPSYIKDELYEIVDDHCCGSNIYRKTVIGAVIDFFDKHPNIQFNWQSYTYEECGVLYIAWIENEMLQTEAFAWVL